MTSELEVPFPQRRQPPFAGRVEPPVVPVAPRWEYRDIIRDDSALLSAEELNALGEHGWELVGVAPTAEGVHFYLKRERPI